MNPKDYGDLAAFFGSIYIVAFGLSENTGNLIGMWTAIVFCATSGSLVALGMADAKPWGWLRIAWFVAWRVCLAMALTMSIVRVLGLYIPSLGPGITISFVAFSITCDPLRTWVINFFKRNVPRYLKNRIFGDDSH